MSFQTNFTRWTSVKYFRYRNYLLLRRPDGENRSGGELEACCAYGKIDSPIGGMANVEWSEKYGIPLCETVEEVVEKKRRAGGFVTRQSGNAREALRRTAPFREVCVY